MRGKHTSKAEILNVSPQEFWILVERRELFVPFAEFPWFKNAPASQVMNVELPSPHHLYWPDLDIDVAVESIENPTAYLILSRALPTKTLQSTSRTRAVKWPRGGPRVARG